VLRAIRVPLGLLAPVGLLHAALLGAHGVYAPRPQKTACPRFRIDARGHDNVFVCGRGERTDSVEECATLFRSGSSAGRALKQMRPRCIACSLQHIARLINNPLVDTETGDLAHRHQPIARCRA
jgi:hypothetical protein